ncbi:MAG: hypothetical protein P1V51_11115 [Deltaproteobacteria bacterium]|nr:hypothetical protein [Deltaproteobacteria bacterium]
MRSPTPAAAFLLSTLLLAACGPGDIYLPPDGGDAGTDGGSGDAGTDGGSDGGTSGREYLPADRLRYGVVSHPRDAAGADSNVWHVFTVDTDGTITGTTRTFQMGRASEGEVAFTPDGEIGIAPLLTGGVGVFKLDADGTPTVIHTALDVGYPNQVVMGHRGERAWTIDFQWEEHGGGIHELAIGADDSVTYVGRIMEGRSLGQMHLLPGRDEALVGGGAVNAVYDDADLFHIDLSVSPPALIQSIDLFGDEGCWASALALTPDERFVLMADNNMLGTGHRVGIARFGTDGLLTALPAVPQPPAFIEDPTGIHPSPSGGRIAVLASFGEALHSLTWDATQADGAFAHEGLAPGGNLGGQLPQGSVMIERGSLAGRILVAEYQHLHAFQHEADGTLTDHGRVALDAGSPPLTLGAIGIQP